MRVLWVSRFVPFPMNAGDRVYSARLAAATAEAGAEVTVLGIADEAPPAAMTAVRNLRWEGVNCAQRGTVPALLRPLPLVTERASPAPIVAAFRRLLDKLAPQVVVVDNYAAGWVMPLLAARRPAPALVYIAHNFEEKLAADIARGFSGSSARKIALLLNALKIRRLERALVKRADLVVALTERDRDELLARNPDKQSLVLPPGFTGSRAAQRAIDATVPRRVVMLGSVRWIAKQINVGEFLEAADAKFHAVGIAFDIIGDVAEEFRASWTPRLKATRFLGFVDNVADELARSRLGLVIEAVGGGFKLKILDYLFARVPVAALAGSFEGVPQAARNQIAIAPTAAALTETVIRLIDDFDALNGMQNACFDAVNGRFEWDLDGCQLAAALAALPAAR
ncbi:glycosyltransferase [Dongia sedimenti]|uniref:Glycosyltransferase n=1 Tax=Dongia sedimenti TaxID=3064282 RepID=A0ABU0YSQ6_9PROT|nr:glycosyltransferase [Rhodospirillaceae bacterium R-7]